MKNPFSSFYFFYATNIPRIFFILSYGSTFIFLVSSSIALRPIFPLISFYHTLFPMYNHPAFRLKWPAFKHHEFSCLYEYTCTNTSSVLILSLSCPSHTIVFLSLLIVIIRLWLQHVTCDIIYIFLFSLRSFVQCRTYFIPILFCRNHSLLHLLDSQLSHICCFLLYFFPQLAQTSPASTLFKLGSSPHKSTKSNTFEQSSFRNLN
jgi:hypothetical protein